METCRRDQRKARNPEHSAGAPFRVARCVCVCVCVCVCQPWVGTERVASKKFVHLGKKMYSQKSEPMTMAAGERLSVSEREGNRNWPKIPPCLVSL